MKLRDFLHPLDAYKRLKFTELRADLLKEDFFEQQYYWLYTKIKHDTTVIDIGANIGDTAIYFAMHPSTKKVYAYEPYPVNFRYASDYIANSPLKEKIELVQNAVSNERRLLQFSRSIQNSTPSAVFSFSSGDGNRGIQIDAVPFNDIVANKKNVAIKCDCEGGEYEIFDGKADLREVYAIQIELHKISESKAKIETISRNIQEKGFKLQTKITKGDTAMLYAERVEKPKK